MPKKIPAPYTDRVVTKQADEILVGDRLYRANGRHPVILVAASNSLFVKIGW